MFDKQILLKHNHIQCIKTKDLKSNPSRVGDPSICRVEVGHWEALVGVLSETVDPEFRYKLSSRA